MADAAAPEPRGTDFPPPDLTDLFAAEDSPMLGGLVLRVAVAVALVGVVVGLLRRRRGRGRA